MWIDRDPTKGEKSASTSHKFHEVRKSPTSVNFSPAPAGCPVASGCAASRQPSLQGAEKAGLCISSLRQGVSSELQVVLCNRCTPVFVVVDLREDSSLGRNAICGSRGLSVSLIDTTVIWCQNRRPVGSLAWSQFLKHAPKKSHFVKHLLREASRRDEGG